MAHALQAIPWSSSTGMFQTKYAKEMYQMYPMYVLKAIQQYMQRQLLISIENKLIIDKS